MIGRVVLHLDQRLLAVPFVRSLGSSLGIVILAGIERPPLPEIVVLPPVCGQRAIQIRPTDGNLQDSL